MRPQVSSSLVKRAAEWDELHRWERSELGKDLRRLGLTYGEIRELIPVPKGTLSYWCREIDLTDEQVAATRERTGPDSRLGIPVDTQWRRRDEIARIRQKARRFAVEHLDDAFFVASVVLYWAEGSKTRNDLSLTNADPAAHRAFVAWVRTYLDMQPRFVLSLHLHEGNAEQLAFAYWRKATGLPEAPFTKTFIKPAGTGHRKNHLKHGICRVRLRNPSDHWNRTMVWIEVVSDCFGPDVRPS